MSLPRHAGRPVDTVSAEAAGRGVPSARRWVIVAMVMLLMIVNFADKSVYGLAGKSLKADLGLTNSQFGLGGSIFFLLFGVSAVVVGFIGNKVPSTKMLLVLALTWSLSLGPVLLAPTFGTLLLSRMFLGASEGPTSPIAVHGVHKWFPESQRSMPTAMVPVGAALGVAISAPLLSGLIADQGWKAAFWVLAAAGPAWAAVWLLLGREGPYESYASASDLADSVAVDGLEEHVPYRRILGASGWWGPLMACGPAYIAFVAFSVWAPTYFEDSLGYSAKRSGLFVGLFAVVALAGVIGASWLSGRLVRNGVSTRWARGALTGGTVAVAGALVLVGLRLHGGPAVALLVIGFGLANASNPIGMLTVSEISPVRQRSAVLAIYQALVTAGGAVAALGVGVMADRAEAGGGAATQGYVTAFTICGALAVVGGAVAAWRTNAQGDAVRLGLQEATAATP